MENLSKIQSDLICNLESFNLTLKDVKYLCQYISDVYYKAFAEGEKLSSEINNPINGYDKSNNIICRFNSKNEASRILGINIARIDQIIKDKSNYRNLYLKLAI